MRPSFRGVVWFAWGVVAVLIAATAAFRMYGEPERTARQPPAVSMPAAPRPAGDGVTPAAVAPAPEAKPPSFDVVTVDGAGQAVIAGRAAPGDRVRVLDGDVTIGEVGADARGEWVLVPAVPIAPGDRQLSVEAVSPDGGAVRRSPDVVALSIRAPEARESEGSGGTSALAVLLPGAPGAPARICSAREGVRMPRPGTVPCRSIRRSMSDRTS